LQHYFKSKPSPRPKNSFAKTGHWADPERSSMNQRKQRGQDQPEAAERQFENSPIAETPGRSVETLLHELEVHQIELEMQNEALRSALTDSAESRRRYAELYDFAAAAYLTLTKEGLIAEINLAMNPGGNSPSKTTLGMADRNRVPMSATTICRCA
jgi:hypothetical protein